MGKIIENRRVMGLTLAGLVVVIVGCAALMAYMSTGDRGEASAQDSVDTVTPQQMEIDVSDSRAEDLYDSRVEDAADSAAVVKLLDTIGIGDVIGKAETTVSTEDDAQVLTVSLTDAVQKADKAALDDNMKLCAQQIMALMPSLDKVQWTYPLMTAGDADEAVTVSFDKKSVAKGLDKEIDKYGKSADAVKELLAEQSGK